MRAITRVFFLVVSFLLLQVDCSPHSILKQAAPAKRQLEQNIVTWDEHSFMIRGERLFFFSGEFHPFRLPVPGLWLDVFQKIKAMGFSGVSFYVDWGLLEGNQGHVVTDGIWSLQPFFDAAAEAGIYLLARPGPYIVRKLAVQISALSMSKSIPAAKCPRLGAPTGKFRHMRSNQRLEPFVPAFIPTVLILCPNSLKISKSIS